jgi:hypothetical protein
MATLVLLAAATQAGPTLRKAGEDAVRWGRAQVDPASVQRAKRRHAIEQRQHALKRDYEQVYDLQPGAPAAKFDQKLGVPDRLLEPDESGRKGLVWIQRIDHQAVAYILARVGSDGNVAIVSVGALTTDYQPTFTYGALGFRPSLAADEVPFRVTLNVTHPGDINEPRAIVAGDMSATFSFYMEGTSGHGVSDFESHILGINGAPVPVADGASKAASTTLTDTPDQAERDSMRMQRFFSRADVRAARRRETVNLYAVTAPGVDVRGSASVYVPWSLLAIAP